jgi:IclR family acetate operon transcriptional repressor
MELLERLGREGGGTLSELAAGLGLPKNAVFRITNTLRARGYLDRDERSLRFTLTDRFVRLIQPRAGRKSLVEAALPEMRALRDFTRETVQIGRRSGEEGVLLEAVDGLHALRISVDPGLRFPLHNNAPGKQLLAGLPAAERRTLLRSLPLARSTARTLTDPAALERECVRILREGYATDFAESDEGIHCVAAPVLDAEGATIAVLWVSAPARRLPRGEFARIGSAVKASAARISRKAAAP